jgi:hypothetical protein
MLCCEITALCQPRLGNDAAEYEDAFAFGPLLSNQDAPRNGAGAKANANTHAARSSAAWIGGARAHVAIADGATESSFSGMWATMLARAYRKGEIQSISALRERTESLAQRWQHSLSFRRLPWYAEEKARMGAFSTLLGLTLAGPGETQRGLWWALAVGDSCLFHLRDDALIGSFPIHQSSEFGNSPLLLSSNLGRNARVWESAAAVMGAWRDGDVFLLATDALAHWLLTQHERKARPWCELMEIAHDAGAGACANEAFAAWVAERRSGSTMRNDDVTCLVVSV